MVYIPLLFAVWADLVHSKRTVSTIPVDCELRRHCKRNGRGLERYFHYVRNAIFFFPKHSFRCFRPYEVLRENNPQLWKGNRHRNLYQKRDEYRPSSGICRSYKDGWNNFSDYLWRLRSDNAKSWSSSLCRFCASTFPIQFPLWKLRMGCDFSDPNSWIMSIIDLPWARYSVGQSDSRQIYPRRGI